VPEETPDLNGAQIKALDQCSQHGHLKKCMDRLAEIPGQSLYDDVVVAALTSAILLFSAS
jgi:hypothetical protein